MRKVVVDEGVPRQLVARLREQGIDAHPFDKGWRGLSNGELLARVEAAGYAVLVTNDKNLLHQRSFRGRMLAVVTLPTNRKRVMLKRVGDLADTIAKVGPAQQAIIEPSGRRILRQHGDGGSDLELPSVEPFAP